MKVNLFSLNQIQIEENDFFFRLKVSKDQPENLLHFLMVAMGLTHTHTHIHTSHKFIAFYG